MKELPILFSTPMVKAILDGRKSVTRRLVKPQPVNVRDARAYANGAFVAEVPVCDSGKVIAARDVTVVPRWTPGMLLWVKETFGYDAHDDRIVYRADHPDAKENRGEGPEVWRWKPSIFMPRVASRITLEVTGVRVERLHDISESDAIAEGVRFFADLPSIHPYGNDPRWSAGDPTATDECLHSARSAFGNLWVSINGPDSWDANPWVWVVSFTRVP